MEAESIFWYKEDTITNKNLLSQEFTAPQIRILTKNILSEDSAQGPSVGL